MTLKERLAKGTSIDQWNLDQAVKIVQEWALELVGDDETSYNFELDITQNPSETFDQIQMHGRNQAKQQIRQRIKDATSLT